MSDVRLIDANALVNVLCEKLRSIDNGRTMRQAAISVADGMRIMELEYCIGLIQCADIIDAVPVVHGRWIEHPDDRCSLFNGWECSECKQIVSGGRGNYCPNCGAKMDAKDMDVPTMDEEE